VAIYISPNCKDRSVDVDGLEGMSQQAVACHRCGFGFLFQLLEDYYPAPATGLLVCDQEGRVLAVGRGVFEATGYQERDLMGRELAEALALSDRGPLELVREWGVRRLGEKLQIRTRAGQQKPVTADFFPAYDADGGLLVAITPRS
jgi:PAS domain S-box-containing protein